MSTEYRVPSAEDNYGFHIEKLGNYYVVRHQLTGRCSSGYTRSGAEVLLLLLVLHFQTRASGLGTGAER